MKMIFLDLWSRLMDYKKNTKKIFCSAPEEFRCKVPEKTAMDAILHWLNYWAGGTEIQGVLLTASHRKLVHRSDMFRVFKGSTDQLRKIILLQLIQASFQLERKSISKVSERVMQMTRGAPFKPIILIIFLALERLW